MKIKFIILCLLSLFLSCNNQEKAQKENGVENKSPAHNSRNSVDWNGTYRGIVPCADCEGIKTEVVLHRDGTYEINQKYIGEQDSIFNETGKFEWNEAGSKITLLNEEDAKKRQFQVGENKLIMLDADGEQIKSELSKYYVLEKSSFDQEITEKYWKLIELDGKKIPTPENGRTEPHFILKANEDRVSGNGGCNVLMGNYKLEDNNKIKFSQMATTMMACQEVEYEHEFLRVFEEAELYNVKKDTLVLKTTDMAPLATFTAVYLY